MNNESRDSPPYVGRASPAKSRQTERRPSSDGHLDVSLFRYNTLFQAKAANNNAIYCHVTTNVSRLSRSARLFRFKTLRDL